MKSELIFTQPVLLLIVCLLLGIGYAWLLYSSKNHLNQKQRLLLGGIRTLLVALIAFLLFNTLWRSLSVESIKPRLVIGVDNSASLKSWSEKNWDTQKESISALLDDIDKNAYDIDVRDFSGRAIENLDSLRFGAGETNFDRFLRKIQTESEGFNLKKVILFSDGILNAGFSPLHGHYPFEISTVGLGDSTQYKDLALLGLTANKLAYLGNKFPLQVDVSAHLAKGQQALVLVKSGGKLVDKKNVHFDSDDAFLSVQFELQANEAGKRRFTVEVSAVQGESNLRNNRREIIIETIDGKHKVLLLAAAPHPDIKALHSILQKNKQFDVSVKVLGQAKDKAILNENFDLLILHQLPNKQVGKNAVLGQLLGRQKPVFFVLGAQSAIGHFNGVQQALGIANPNNHLDQVKGIYNEDFKRFPKPDGLNEVLSDFSPLFVPFGNYRPRANSDVLLYQQVGSVKTDRPLLVLNTEIKPKMAIFVGEGLWKWRLEEYQNTGGQSVLDELILRCLELISVKQNNKKLRVYPTQDVIGSDQNLVFQTEAYDDLFQRIEPVEVKLRILRNEGSKEFDYTATIDQSTFQLAKLEAGDYRYKAEASVLGKKQSAEGRFIVQNQSLEQERTQADFNFLRTLAKETKGRFYHADQIGEIAGILNANPAKSKMVSTEKLQEIINLHWLLPLILLLAGLEWGIRKYLGLY